MPWHQHITSTCDRLKCLITRLKSVIYVYRWNIERYYFFMISWGRQLFNQWSRLPRFHGLPTRYYDIMYEAKSFHKCYAKKIIHVCLIYRKSSKCVPALLHLGLYSILELHTVFIGSGTKVKCEFLVDSIIR